jgi:hypothetical protein
VTRWARQRSEQKIIKRLELEGEEVVVGSGVGLRTPMPTTTYRANEPGGTTNSRGGRASPTRAELKRSDVDGGVP